ncbi:MAG: hypothetical protein A3I26_00620 [Candidatus Yanofskybacteria bacterium RIFCSPLOWO2_02_FULL_43_10]|uniref:Uncharacterized protein n=1 Tax=Candidatus Yanofskybacteria bacterium RIFCSPLOWO2_12_FULL_43_11b TaxID=1802710 RepID=A0A1F8H9F5_9BACT|nr:MAG: hypothetical protein A2742_00850 [Candidatus Yanofskybacteria bacterium RIFCSPHIGHO2_01_FULL_43_32]OGN11309.1 MAG: hypothetical protein A3C69_00985 [Candidatus Yanofskybacteria bacterium RIFCSPHIGHO2_02_FULL_43_12]OGN17907.1 MAG: hypothetical protein A3E34_03020 [Candidatus Yanofskybacteria bacterium RIFCSPHIGHO2_12_FULL_43_11]OGN24309.1 MAG: hypothetical protein A2923_00090 [Candidatus Yanofskybacteria bacterium RIFCSPLOWO2_01_FULL_43_46]OGN29662.1 MAG: hypothetical protein A3I26_00620
MILHKRFRGLHVFILAICVLFAVSLWKTCFNGSDLSGWWMAGLWYSMFQGAVAIAHLVDLAEGNLCVWLGPENTL